MSLPVEEQRQARIVRELVAAAGGVENCEETCGKSKSLFSAYQSNNDHRSITLRDIELLESVTAGSPGHPHVTQYLARRSGYSLFRLPEARACGGDMLSLLAADSQAKGQSDNRMLSALADGVVTPEEATGCIPLVRQNIEIAAQILAELEAIAKGDSQ